MEISKATFHHIPAIQDLATRTWYATYSELVPKEQIAYMLDVFYKTSLLQEQLIDPKHHFLVMMENDTLIGYSHCIEQTEKVKLSKLYFDPTMQGKGLGKQLMKEIFDQTKALNYSILELCVNRGNPAQYFYEKMGFKIIKEEDFPIGDYWMNDYVMQKQLE